MKKKKIYSAYPGLRFSKDGITILINIDARTPKKNGLFPVRIQVTCDRKQRYYPTGKELSIDDWNRLPEIDRGRLLTVRKEIINSFYKIESAVKSLSENGFFSFDNLNLLLGKGVGDSLNTAFRAKIASLESDERIGSQLYYTTALKSISAFKGDNIRFSDITPEWLTKYEKHLLQEGKSYSTIGMYQRAIRSVINDARSSGFVKDSQYPFGKNKYRIKTGEGRKLALSMQHIKAVVSFSDGSEATERYRDLWFFSYLCNGINFADILRLKYSNIVGDEICFFRQKTIRTSKVKREIQAIITPEMQAIIERWGNQDKRPCAFIFPYLTGDETPLEVNKKVSDVTRRVNRKLKVIGSAVGIEGLTTYVARHSYATVLKRSGANIAFISESLGHADLKTTESYLASFEKEERRKNAALLTKFE